MNLLDLVLRRQPLVPWGEGEKIPWHEPGFSGRMLEEHLSQEHDLASRRFERIDRQVSWIDGEILSRRPSRVLDLACGPGLFSDRPHLVLRESAWDPDTSTASERYFVIDARTGATSRHGATIQAYSESGYRSLLGESGFSEVELRPSLSGDPDDTDDRLLAILARR